MATSVLDASALLAYMRGERGADAVAAALQQGCAASSVNIAEVLAKLFEVGADPVQTLAQLDSLGDALQITDFTVDGAVATARLRPATKAIGLSLADRACLALAQRLGLPALTADRAWERADVDLHVVVVRD